jgi:gamma-glutamyltranspeptidase / glutathione hydrolase
MRPMTRGVVAAVESLAATAGAEVLRAGGNAADAAVAAAFAEGVVNPIYCGIGGGFHGIFWDASSKEAFVVSSGGYAPGKARPDMWRGTGRAGAIWSVAGQQNALGYQASMVPGFVRGAELAWKRFGSGNVGWSELLQPAIRLAVDGFAVYPYLYRLWLSPSEYMRGFIEGSHGPSILGHTEASRRIYLHDDGSVYEIGETLIQRDYGNTLMRLAEQGAGEFYEGLIAREIADDFRRNGGLLDEDDLRSYQATLETPIVGTFKNYSVLTESSPSVGPLTIELLNILEGYDLPSYGFNTASYLDLLARAIRLVFRDRLAHLGDPKFVDVPLARLLSKEYAAECRDRLARRPGSAEPDPKVTLRRAPRTEETTHVTVVDETGNGAAITHSLGQSSGVVTPGLGFLHNSHMEMFDPVPGSRNSIAPHKRPITGGGPALFLRHGELALLIGSPAGARKVTAMVQAFLAMEEFGLSLEEAVGVDRIHAEDEPDVVIVEPHFPPEPLLGLAQLGHKVRFEWYTARLAGVLRDASGALSGGSDPRGDRGLAIVD